MYYVGFCVCWFNRELPKPISFEHRFWCVIPIYSECVLTSVWTFDKVSLLLSYLVELYIFCCVSMYVASDNVYIQSTEMTFWIGTLGMLSLLLEPGEPGRLNSIDVLATPSIKFSNSSSEFFKIHRISHSQFDQSGCKVTLMWLIKKLLHSSKFPSLCTRMQTQIKSVC